MSFSRLFLAVLLITSAAALPYTTTQKRASNLHSMKTTLNTHYAGNMKNIISNDKKRLAAMYQTFKGSSKRSTKKVSSGSDVVGTGTNGFVTTASVQVGNPPTTYTLIVDTGSSNTFVGANTPYVPTKSSQDTSEPVAVFYGSGNFSGNEFIDDLTLGSATIRQSIGVANISQGFTGFDGILGLGPDRLTLNTLQNERNETIPTVTDNLAQQGMIPSALVGISIPLTTANTGTDAGSLDFGAPDTSQTTSAINFVPITNTNPSSEFWGIDQSITYGDQKIPILSTTAGIVDTGTTLLFVATEAFNAYVNATNATMDSATGMLVVNNATNLQSLFFQMGSNTLEFTANAQIFPRSLNEQIGGDNASTYLIMQDIGHGSGQGFDFNNGFTWLQRFYSVFDTPNAQVGFATTTQTYALSN